MKALIQRVRSASVDVGGETIGAIDQGLLILLGVAASDNEQTVVKLMDKCLKYRVFSDEAGRMNHSVQDVGGSVLLVSQFTLCADTARGLRPGFSHAAEPALAKSLYEQSLAYIRSVLGHVETGQFGADMQVSLVNDGPVTFMLEVE